jgi:hypothetical protein
MQYIIIIIIIIIIINTASTCWFYGDFLAILLCNFPQFAVNYTGLVTQVCQKTPEMPNTSHS